MQAAKQPTTIEVPKESLTVLEYIARLQSRPVEDLVGEILDGWLTENYCQEADPWEHARCLPSTIITNRKGELDEKAAYRTMKSNLRQLSV